MSECKCGAMDVSDRLAAIITSDGVEHRRDECVGYGGAPDARAELAALRAENEALRAELEASLIVMEWNNVELRTGGAAAMDKARAVLAAASGATGEAR